MRRFSLSTMVVGCALLLSACAPAYQAGGFTPNKSTLSTPEVTVETVEPTVDSPETPSTPEPPTPEPKERLAHGNEATGGPNCDVEKCIALTFDDGPGDYTAQVLDALRAANVPATFFVMGRQVKAQPELLRRAVAEGHAIGGHSWSHPQLTKLNNERLMHELVDTNKEIEKVVGFTPNLMRPPYGAVNHRVRKVMADQGLAAILWDVDTLDWKDHNLDKAMGYVRQQTQNGSIILMHDVHEIAPQAVPLIVKEYSAKGFKFVTIPQLFAGKEMLPGAKHFNRFKVLK
ncbi:polysaccharide deacetylase family protein [Boudabousia marimammalium]|uniref:NodB homology domain-containing protein n=1 Tax=Boudabousia marimammalium TaxID=156892 RepID=A0A1Q5PMG7_9ACTO|nr:polysaccharide deacetylase family protein [Boudabousia marimammalium]OKL48640.1 hypothetical protein BM477_05405 [Boudabousia marimammalium]